MGATSREEADFVVYSKQRFAEIEAKKSEIIKARSTEIARIAEKSGILTFDDQIICGVMLHLHETAARAANDQEAKNQIAKWTEAGQPFCPTRRKRTRNQGVSAPIPTPPVESEASSFAIPETPCDTKPDQLPAEPVMVSTESTLAPAAPDTPCDTSPDQLPTEPAMVGAEETLAPVAPETPCDTKPDQPPVEPVIVAAEGTLAPAAAANIDDTTMETQLADAVLSLNPDALEKPDQDQPVSITPENALEATATDPKVDAPSPPDPTLINNPQSGDADTAPIQTAPPDETLTDTTKPADGNAPSTGQSRQPAASQGFQASVAQPQALAGAKQSAKAARPPESPDRRRPEHVAELPS